mmetsp:Transcript_4846/g.11346  ORF Transcript_4846/g.11346 Transcript_4846/m.11346 type:complete len:107 (-) Transcript_4846:132-452(-)
MAGSLQQRVSAQFFSKPEQMATGSAGNSDSFGAGCGSGVTAGEVVNAAGADVDLGSPPCSGAAVDCSSDEQDHASGQWSLHSRLASSRLKHLAVGALQQRVVLQSA